MEIKGEEEVTQIGLIFLGLNCLLDWSKFGLNFGLIGLNFEGEVTDWSNFSWSKFGLNFGLIGLNLV